MSRESASLNCHQAKESLWFAAMEHTLADLVEAALLRARPLSDGTALSTHAETVADQRCVPAFSRACRKWPPEPKVKCRVSLGS